MMAGVLAIVQQQSSIAWAVFFFCSVTVTVFLSSRSSLRLWHLILAGFGNRTRTNSSWLMEANRLTCHSSRQQAHRHARRLGVSEVPLEVVNLVSHATQSRLRSLLEKVSALAQHRSDVVKDEEHHEQTSDVRSQLRFFEQLERLEKQRKDEQEREILLKAAKSRARQEDPEQARLKQKAKEMQQQELAQMRQRDANLTALAAIGPRKKRKMDSPGGTAACAEVSSGASASGASLSSSVSSPRQPWRQRITRVNLRDLIVCLEQDGSTARSLTLYKALLK